MTRAKSPSPLPSGSRALSNRFQQGLPDLAGTFSWGKWLDRASTVLGVAAMFGCGPCAAVSAGISFGRGIDKVSHGDASGDYDLVGAASFGAGKLLVRGGEAIRAARIARAPKGVRGMTNLYRNQRQAAAAWHRGFERSVVKRHDRIDRAYGIFTTGQAVYGEYKSYRQRRR